MNPINRLLRLAGLKLSRVPKLAQPWKSPIEAQIKLVSRKNPVIFDVGANRGSVAKIYLQHFPACKLHCFEPLPACSDQLRKDFLHSSNVKIHQLALSDRTGQNSFFFNSFDQTSSFLPLALSAQDHWAGVEMQTQEVIQVETATLDEFIHSEGIEEVDILKMDVQGAEMAVLRGAEKALESGRIKVIYFEIITCETYKNQSTIQDYLSFLEEKKFSLVGFF